VSIAQLFRIRAGYHRIRLTTWYNKRLLRHMDLYFKGTQILFRLCMGYIGCVSCSDHSLTYTVSLTNDLLRQMPDLTVNNKGV
jgi:hypothetical protein